MKALSFFSAAFLVICASTGCDNGPSNYERITPQAALEVERTPPPPPISGVSIVSYKAAMPIAARSPNSNLSVPDRFILESNDSRFDGMVLTMRGGINVSAEVGGSTYDIISRDGSIIISRDGNILSISNDRGFDKVADYDTLYVLDLVKYAAAFVQRLESDGAVKQKNKVTSFIPGNPNVPTSLVLKHDNVYKSVVNDIYDFSGTRTCSNNRSDFYLTKYSLVSSYEDDYPGYGPQWVRGESVSSTASAACYGAKNDANYKCANTRCTGCQEILECDTLCGMGDFFCSAGVWGRRCDGSEGSCWPCT